MSPNSVGLPVSIVMIEDDEGHATLIERNIRRAGVNNQVMPFRDGTSALEYLMGEDGKGTVAIGVTDDLVGKHSAAELIKHATVALGGQGGGGRPDMAQGGGPDGGKADAAIAAIRSAL